MTETLISNWNDRVLRGDTVFVLGDFMLTYGKKNAPLVDSILSRLNGQKWLIAGNHDRQEVRKSGYWVKVKDYHEISISLGGDHKQKIVMSHFPMLSWNKMHHGSWMLHGHTHGTLVGNHGKLLDVGVDCHQFAPISINEVELIMRDKHFTPIDHHK